MCKEKYINFLIYNKFLFENIEYNKVIILSKEIYESMTHTKNFQYETPIFNILTNDIFKTQIKPKDFIFVNFYMNIAFGVDWREKFNKGDKK